MSEKERLLELYRAVRAKIRPEVLDRVRKAATGPKEKGPAYPGHAALALFLKDKDPAFRKRVLEKARETDVVHGIAPPPSPAAPVVRAQAATSLPRAGGQQLDRLRDRSERLDNAPLFDPRKRGH
jgi:hypothetical protein